MAHQPKPFFRTARNAWYVQLGKQQIKLCPGPQNAATEKAAWARFHEMMAERGKQPVPQVSANSASGPSVALLVDKYLDWCQKHREARTYEGYRDHLQAFLDALTNPAEMPALALKPFHVQEWLDAHPTWGQTYRRNAIAAVKRVYSWAEELGYIEANPVKKIKRPAAKRREHVISPEDWKRIRDHYPEADPFRDLLEFAWETGCRPQEARHIEARHVRLADKLIAIPPEEAKGRKKWRLIRLEGRALEIVARRAGAEGKLFPNADGNPWTAYAINCRFCRLQKHLGIKHFAYALRHAFCQRMLESGVDHLTVAELLGHVNGNMVSAVYSHMNKADDHLRAALLKGSEPKAG